MIAEPAEERQIRMGRIQALEGHQADHVGLASDGDDHLMIGGSDSRPRAGTLKLDPLRRSRVNSGLIAGERKRYKLVLARPKRIVTANLRHDAQPTLIQNSDQTR